MTRPSSRMHDIASPATELKAAGLDRGDQAFVNGSKISPRGVSFPADEYSPPTAYTRPSFTIPEPKNWRVFAMANGPDQLTPAVSYRPFESGARRYQSAP